MSERIVLAMQKSGRLTQNCLELLQSCGLKWEAHNKRQLFASVENFPMDIIFLRDDDIPEYIANGTGDIGIIGQNVYEEAMAPRKARDTSIVRPLGMAKCRLSLAVPEKFLYDGPESLSGLTVATSYPELVKRYFESMNVEASVVTLSGSVEIAPSLNIADGICDIVSTGSTLKTHGLKEVETILQSEAILIQNDRKIEGQKKDILRRLLARIDSVNKSKNSKYIMMHAPKSALSSIIEILPGMEEPTVMELVHDAMKVAIHAVAKEEVFWETIEELKAVGASSILVLPIEKAID